MRSALFKKLIFHDRLVRRKEASRMKRMDRFSQGCRVFLEFFMVRNGRLNGLVFPQGDDVYAASCDNLPHFVDLVLSAGTVQSRQSLPSGTGPDDDLCGFEGRLGRLIRIEGRRARSPSGRTPLHRQPFGQDGLHLSQRTQSHLQLLDLVCRPAVGFVDFIT